MANSRSGKPEIERYWQKRPTREASKLVLVSRERRLTGSLNGFWERKRCFGPISEPTVQLLVECKEYLKVSSAGGKKDFLSFGTFIVFCKKQVRDQRLFAVNMLPHCLAVPRTVMLWPSLGHLVPSRGDSPLFNPLHLMQRHCPTCPWCLLCWPLYTNLRAS